MHVTRVRVRFPETDKMGVVYHGNYFPYFEIGRTELLRDAGMAYTEIERRGLRLVVVEAGARYFAPAVYDQQLEIRTRVSELRGARVVFSYEVTSNGTRLAEGRTSHACLGPSGRPVRLPEDVVRLLKGADGGR